MRPNLVHFDRHGHHKSGGADHNQHRSCDLVDDIPVGGRNHCPR